MFTRISMIVFFAAFALDFVGLAYMAIVAAIAAAAVAIALTVER
jgi:hypothetical protein